MFCFILALLASVSDVHFICTMPAVSIFFMFYSCIFGKYTAFFLVCEMFCRGVGEKLRRRNFSTATPLAESEGFKPPERQSRSTDFESAPIVHSGNSPLSFFKTVQRYDFYMRVANIYGDIFAKFCIMSYFCMVKLEFIYDIST